MNGRYEYHVLLRVRLRVLCRFPPVCRGHCVQLRGKKSLGTKAIWIYSAIEKRECGKLLGGFTSPNNKALAIWIEALCIHWPCVTFENHYVGKPRPEDTKEMGVGTLACQSDVWSSVLINHSCKVNTLEALLKRSPKVICREKANSSVFILLLLFF